MCMWMDVCVCVCTCTCERVIEREGRMVELPVAGVLIWVSLSEPHTRVTVLCTYVYMLACLFACDHIP